MHQSAITLDFSSCDNPIKGAGDATPVTYGNCALSDYAAVGPIVNPNGTSFYGVDADGCFASPSGSLGFCFSIPFVDKTSSFVSGGLRRPPTYLASSDTFNYNLITTAASTTDANQVAALASLGYNGPPLGDPSTFAIPQGASFDAIVAEPPPLGIFLLAAIVTISLVYRNQRVVRSASPFASWP